MAKLTPTHSLVSTSHLGRYPPINMHYPHFSPTYIPHLFPQLIPHHFHDFLNGPVNSLQAILDSLTHQANTVIVAVIIQQR